MTPRTLPATWKAIEKTRRRAAEQATRDDAPMAVVQHEGLVFIRPLTRALAVVSRHPRAKILYECFPEKKAVTR